MLQAFNLMILQDIALSAPKMQRFVVQELPWGGCVDEVWFADTNVQG
jgi:hypothetical protein